MTMATVVEAIPDDVEQWPKPAPTVNWTASATVDNGTSADAGHRIAIQDILAEVMAFLVAPALGKVCVCCRTTLAASSIHWAGHLDNACRCVGRQHGRHLFPRLRNLTGDAARAEFSACASGFCAAMHAAAAVHGCGPPVAAQVQQFVTRVRSHHSWYKHLPIEEGVAFRLSMSPVAGMRYLDGRHIDYLRGDGTQFHYTWCTTEDYRQRYHFFTWEEVGVGSTAGQSVTTTPDMLRPLLVPERFAVDVPVTACVHVDAASYNLLEGVYSLYRQRRDAGSAETDMPAQATSSYTRRTTGRGLPQEVVADMARLYAFEQKHPRETWAAAEPEVLRDAQDLCAALFPHHTAEAVRVQAAMLLFSRTLHDVSNILVLADGARTKVRMSRVLLDCVRLIWGEAPSLSLSMSEEELRKAKQDLRRNWNEVNDLFQKPLRR
mmetsp:Transcript_49333/g.90350  ORF Transcript_49333/g.90350 Transcript_49333/m.90350 type:complete len:435 (+) Transcript_49333:68-1372(+)